jgi:uncharacterized protein
LDKKLLDILVCPVCKGPIRYDKSKGELICRADRLAFPVKDNIPYMVEDDARQISEQEYEALKP